MPGDHQFFVGRNHPDRDLALRRRDPRTASCICRCVECDAQPGRRLADSLANLRRVLADAGGEHQPIDSAQHRRERADFLGSAIDKVVHREPCLRFSVGQAGRACRY